MRISTPIASTCAFLSAVWPSAGAVLESLHLDQIQNDTLQTTIPFRAHNSPYQLYITNYKRAHYGNAQAILSIASSQYASVKETAYYGDTTYDQGYTFGWAPRVEISTMKLKSQGWRRSDFAEILDDVAYFIFEKAQWTEFDFMAWKIDDRDPTAQGSIRAVPGPPPDNLNQTSKTLTYLK